MGCCQGNENCQKNLQRDCSAGYPDCPAGVSCISENLKMCPVMGESFLDFSDQKSLPTLQYTSPHGLSQEFRYLSKLMAGRGGFTAVNSVGEWLWVSWNTGEHFSFQVVYPSE
jgi:hypothetical protein